MGGVPAGVHQAQAALGKRGQTVAMRAFGRHTGDMAKKDPQDSLDIEPRFLTLEQTARYLSVSVQQVYSLVRSGELPGIKIGGRGVWRVGVDQLERYVERLYEETADWTKKHPLGTRADDADDGDEGD